MPTNWGLGKTALLLGAERGALAGVEEALRTVGFRVVRAPQGSPLVGVLADEHVSVIYIDAEATASALTRVRELRGSHAEVPAVLFRTKPLATDVADAMRAGAADFLPAGAPEATILSRLHDALDARTEPPAVVEAHRAGLGGLIGSSAAMRRVFNTIERVARFKTSVLVLGESGTGKELVAHALHLSGPRKDRAFVPVNCATLGKELLENELFGHERGAFTGANAQKAGLFEVATGGTLFLDEVGEMDAGTQAKLLRVLERSEFRRVGGTTKVKVDVAVVAATNRDLRMAIAAGRFREDLFYRLKVVTVTVPPLRDRREDIPALVEAFIEDFNRRHGGRIRGVTAEAMRRLMAYSWPGNVRELKNVVDSAVMLADGDLLDERLLDEAVGAGDAPAPPADALARDIVAMTHPGRGGPPTEVRIQLPARLMEVEREVILQTVRRTPGRRQAARELGIGLRTLYAKLRAYGLNAEG